MMVTTAHYSLFEIENCADSLFVLAQQRFGWKQIVSLSWVIQGFAQVCYVYVLETSLNSANWHSTTIGVVFFATNVIVLHPFGEIGVAFCGIFDLLIDSVIVSTSDHHALNGCHAGDDFVWFLVLETITEKYFLNAIVQVMNSKHGIVSIADGNPDACKHECKSISGVWWPRMQWYGCGVHGLHAMAGVFCVARCCVQA